MSEYSIGFFGDLTTGENYQLKYDRRARINILRQKGYDVLFENVEIFLNKFDFNIANLETPLTDVTVSSIAQKKRVLHWADKEIVPQLLKKYKISAVSLGNNHILDYDKQGFLDTQNALQNAGIGFFGAGINLDRASMPFIKRISLYKRNVNLYVIGGYKYHKDYDKEYDFYAKETKCGVFLLTPESAENIIKTIKENDKDSKVIMFPHFGYDLMKNTNLQIEYAHKFIDYGADFVIGHGPHYMNSIEIYKGKPVLYGIGNFIFPANFSAKTEPYNMVAELKFFESDNNVHSKINIYPIYMDNNSFNPVTRLLRKDELDKFIDLLVEYDESVKDKIIVDSSSDLIKIEFNYE